MSFVKEAHADDDATLKTVMALKKCATDRGLSREVLASACEGRLPDNLEAYKCYTQCVQQEVGMMDQSGKIDPEKAARSLVDPKQQQRMRDIATKCPGDDTTDLCAKAFSVDRCYVKEDKDMYTRNCNTLVQTVS